MSDFQIDNIVSNNGAIMIAEALQENTTLKELRMNGLSEFH